MASGPAHLWPQPLVTDLQTNETKLGTFSEETAHPLPHCLFSVFSHEHPGWERLARLQGP